MGLFDFMRGNERPSPSSSKSETLPNATPPMVPLDWLMGKRDYRTTKPRSPSPAEAARGPQTSASYEEVKFHVGQDLVGACMSGNDQVIAKVKRLYSLSVDEWEILSKKVSNNEDIEPEIDIAANRIYWEGRG
jgi:hypothetical protein